MMIIFDNNNNNRNSKSIKPITTSTYLICQPLTEQQKRDKVESPPSCDPP